MTHKSHHKSHGSGGSGGTAAAATGAKKTIPHHIEPNRAEPEPAERPTITRSLFSMKLFNAEKDLPIVYAKEYNIACFGLELIHLFDTQKYSKLASYLNIDFLDTPFAHKEHNDDLPAEADEHHHSHPRQLRFLRPNRPVSMDELAMHHSRSYLESVHHNKAMVARVTEIWLLNLTPECLIEKRLLEPLRWQVAGSIFATHLAMQHGWAINLAGGFHQASAHSGDTFCLYSDVCLAMKYVWRRHPLQKFMILDLDAHQATGVERDIAELEPKRRKMVYMVDMFNSSISPPDQRADMAIDLRVELARYTGDSAYLQRLEEAMKTAFSKFKPNVIIYIAGQDGLREDRLGMMNLSDDALKRRDEIVFSWATEREKVPIVMLLGGGYLPHGARVQADSIRNLFSKGLIWGGHRSGSRTLTRPRTQKNPLLKDSAHKSGASEGIDAVSVVSQLGERRTKIVRVAPVESRFLKKSNKDTTAKKQ